ncbi:MAG: glycoside hydrolase family 38 C-terminal domain-containing protein [Thermoproteota archaeon]
MVMVRLKKVEPTVFFVREEEELKNVVELTIENSGEEREASLNVRAESKTYEVIIGKISKGEGKYSVNIPDIRQAMKIRFGIYVGGQLQDEVSVIWKPQRHWLVYVIERSHHDPSYTDIPENLLEEYNGFYDTILQFCEETRDWPDESKFRYQVETASTILHYMKSRQKEVVDKLLNLMKEGRIEVAALYGNQVTGLSSSEELIRLLYPAFQLKRKYGISIKSAEINDIPGLSWGLSSVLANSGVRYLIACLPRWYFGNNHPNWDEREFAPHGGPRAFYWSGIDGSKVLFWYGKNGWDQVVSFVGDYEQTCRELPKCLMKYEAEGYPFDAITVRVISGARDNSPPTIKPSYIAREWNERWAFPRIIIATNSRFFEYIESKYGDRLPIYRGEIPDTDYVVGATSTPLETGINRITHERISSAEKFCTIANLVSDFSYPEKSLRRAYERIFMFDEHCWGMHHPIGPAQDSSISSKCNHAYVAAALAHDCLSKSTNRIADQINLPNEGYHIIIFNPLSWPRTDLVRASFIEPSPCGFPMHLVYDQSEEARKEKRPPILVAGTAIGRDLIDLPYELVEKTFDLIDENTGEKVPYQIVEMSSPQAPIPFAGHRYALSHVDRRHALELVFVAKDVPSVGYKSFRIAPSEKREKFVTSIKVTNNTLENRFYKITIDEKTGTITSIFDKELNKEIVDRKAAHSFNQLIVRTVIDGKQHIANVSSIERGEAGPVFGSIVLKGNGLGCPQITQEIIVYEDLKRIDVANRLLKDSTPMLEMYFSFPFDVDDPNVKFEASGSLITPLVDQIPGSNTDYYPVQHWANVSNKDLGITLSSIEAHLLEFGGLWYGYLSGAHHGVTYPGYCHEFLKPGDIKKGHMYSYVMNTNFRTNFQPIQVSDMLFRYSLTSHKGDWIDGRSVQFGWEAQNPLIAVYIKGKQKGLLPKSKSFCRIDKQNIVLLNMKVAENGDGIILRIMEMEGADTQFMITLSFIEISDAYLTNPVEENERILKHNRNSIIAEVKAFSIATIRVSYDLTHLEP